MLTLKDLQKLEWNVFSRVVDAKIPDQDAILDRVIDFECDLPIVSIFVDPQGTVFTLPLPATLAQLLAATRKVVQISDDCVNCECMNKLSKSDENRHRWEALRNDDRDPLPDFVIHLQE